MKLCRREFVLVASLLGVACGGEVDNSTSKPGAGGTATKTSAAQDGITGGRSGATSDVTGGGASVDTSGTVSDTQGGSSNVATTATECLYDGVAYRIGAHVVLAGACWQCWCLVDGTMPCDMLECNPNCTYANVDHKVGDQFPAKDGCSTCTCEPAGVTCTNDTCGPCVDGGNTYNYGDHFISSPSNGPCSRCTCGKNGLPNCTPGCPEGGS